MKAQGSSSVRAWLTANYQGSKEAPIWTDLWTSACMVDFHLSKAGGSEEQVNLILASDDNMEMALRRLASFVYAKRTGDHSGALHMLAVKPPGSNVDLAPSWLVEESTLHSKMEYQRADRVSKMNRGGGGGPGRGDGGGGGGNGRGKGGGQDGGKAGGRGGQPRGRGRGRN